MARLSEKYVAGFFDADGSITLNWHQKTWTRPQLRLSFSQLSSQDEVLKLIHRDYGGRMRTIAPRGTTGQITELTFEGKHADMLVNRIAKYSVIKRAYALTLQERARSETGDKDELKRWCKEQRRQKCLPLPNFPARKWLAGYLDGDGCFSASLSASGSAVISCSVGTWIHDVGGIEIIAKNFGGGIYPFSGKPDVRQWRLNLNPSKAKEFLAYFGRYSIVKKSQIDFILSCAEMGHYRNGERIKAELKQLKAHGHRLSESAPQGDATVGAAPKGVTIQ